MKIRLKNYNLGLLIICIILNIVGVLFVASASSFTARIVTRQIYGSFFGIALCIFCSFIDYKFILKYSRVVHGIILAALIAVIVFGTAFGKNAVRWLEVPGVGQVQPAEFLKYSLIITLADFLSQPDTNINRLKDFGIVLLLFIAPTFFVLIQPNLSCVFILTVIFISILFVSKIKKEYLWIGLIAAVIIMILTFVFFNTGLVHKIPFLKAYQIERVETFFNPDANSEGNYQQENSLKAIGSGRITGKGFNNDSTLSVKNAGWLAEETNDFIFAVIGEEIGFRGAIIVIILFMIIIIQCFYIAYHTRDEAAKLVCTGVGSWIAFQSLVNIGVALRVMPNTGVPLPFFSQGLSSLVAVYLGISIVLNISQDTKVYRI